MDIKIEMSDPVPIYIQILEQLKLKIAQKELVAGDKLPSVREMAVKLEINPRTVSNAYKELTHMGLVLRKKGIGLFVTDNCQEFSEEEKKLQIETKIQELLSFGKTLGYHSNEILELIKKIIEGETNE
ncbi:GntR family transcriptional regulator [bacterium]|nr:GntR family transcriptional regulator [bacterium]